MAMAVATTATLTDRMKAARTCGSCQAMENQRNVKPEIGQLSTTDRSNA